MQDNYAKGTNTTWHMVLEAYRTAKTAKGS